MKKNVWSLVILTFALVFTACSNDDDEQNIAEAVAGNYVGTITVAMEDGTPMGEPSQDTISIVYVGDNMIDLELKNFKFAGTIPVGELKVPKVSIKNDEKVSGKADQVAIMNGAIKADLEVSGTMNSKKADLKIKVNAPLAAGLPSIVMNVTFVGDKK